MIKNTLIMLMVTAFLLLMLEGACRIFFPEMAEDRTSGQANDNVFISNGKRATLVYSDNYESIFARVRGASHTDLVDYLEAIPAGARKLFILGDSVTYGYGQSFSTTFAGRLDLILNVAGNEPVYTVILAWPGGQNDSEINEVLRLLEDYSDEGDHLLYAFNFNDVVPVSAEAIAVATKSEFIATIDGLRYKYGGKSALIKTMSYYGGILRNRNWSSDCSPGSIRILSYAYTFSYGGPGFEEESALAWREFEDRIGKITARASELGMTSNILVLPAAFQIPGFENIDNLNFDCATIDARERIFALGNRYFDFYYDPLEYFIAVKEAAMEEDNGEKLYHFRDDNHPNTLGHSLISEYLVRQGAFR